MTNKNILNLEKNIEQTRFLLAKIVRDKIITFEKYSKLLDSTLLLHNTIQELKREKQENLEDK
ncbi:hypothetical protein IGI39_004891 [Enterococcus sp. AZ135]|uniref:hypothetical protein n=1 Tax=unclassified Enterococcus TaxID=2608891 RepID=UPI003F27CDCC